MGIGVSGLMSGLDTESIISKMMEIEKRPILLLQKREAGYQAKISALGTLKSGLSDLQTAIQALKTSADFTAFTATSGNTDVMTVSASDDAAPGTYYTTVTQLAQAQQERSAAFTASDEVVGTGTITIQVGSADAVDVTIDSDNNTLAGIASAINNADAGVTAAVVYDGSGNYYLTMTSQETGTANTITFSVADDDGNNDDAAGLSGLYTTPPSHTLTETQAAKNSQLTLNGIPVERAGNTIDDLIDGVTLTLKQEDPANPFSITVSRDLDSIKSKVQDFVDNYNSLVDTFDDLQSYNADTSAGGTLLGDSTTSTIRSRLQSMLYTQVAGVDAAVNGLSGLGIAVDRYGKLSVDDAALTTALENNRTDVVTFFTQTTTGSEGFAIQLDDLLDSYLGSTDGLLKAKTDGLQSSIDDIDDQVERINDRLAMKEETLRNQFNALETLLSDFQATSSALSQQLQSLSALNSQISNMSK